MNELLGLGGEAAEHVNLLLDEVFHGLHVVVGHRIDVLHALCILLGKPAVDVAQRFKQAVVEAFQLWQG